MGNNMEKLQKVIANAGYTSRRKAEVLIEEGKVKVNGEEAYLGMRVASTDKIEVEGILLTKNPLQYYLLYKPEGYVSTTADEHNRKTVIDLINTTERIYPIGRLDFNTSGLLLLTNDGDLTHRLLHPKYKITKTYIAKVSSLVTMKDINILKRGIYIDEIKIIPDKIKVKSKNIKNKTSIIEIVVHDGKNHEIKKIFAAINMEVIALKRTTFADLNLNGLKKGEYRLLNPKEVKKLLLWTNKKTE